MSWISNDAPETPQTQATTRSEVRGTAKANVWIQPHPKETGRWQVKREGATRASRVFDTQGDAEQFGRELARREKVELKVAGRDGQVRESDSYGHDPRNIPG
jgi:hypothetical protein